MAFQTSHWSSVALSSSSTVTPLWGIYSLSRQTSTRSSEEASISKPCCGLTSTESTRNANSCGSRSWRLTKSSCEVNLKPTSNSQRSTCLSRSKTRLSKTYRGRSVSQKVSMTITCVASSTPTLWSTLTLTTAKGWTLSQASYSCSCRMKLFPSQWSAR